MTAATPLKCSPEVLTSEGVYFNLLDPEATAHAVTIESVAHALSHVARFGGHTHWHYSVAQHSIYVSQLLPRSLRLAGLLHDVAEAFIGDVPTPLKQLLPDYQKIERRVEKALFKRFGLPEELPAEVKYADLRMLAAERMQLMPATAGVAWDILRDVQPPAFQILPVAHEVAKDAFIDTYYTLLTGLN